MTDDVERMFDFDCSHCGERRNALDCPDECRRATLRPLDDVLADLGLEAEDGEGS